MSQPQSSISLPPLLYTSEPDPSAAALVAVLIRYVLAMLATVGLYHGTLSDSAMQVIGSAAIGIATVCWALWNKFQQYRHAHVVAQVNAQRPAGSPPLQPKVGGLLSA